MSDAERLSRLSRELLVVAFSSQWRVVPGMYERMARWLDEQFLRPGETIYREGDIPELLYFMGEGRVRFSRAGGTSYAREGRWVIGAHEVLADKPRVRTATALTDLRLVTIPAEHWVAIIEDNVFLARRMALGIAGAVTMLHSRVGNDGGFDTTAPPLRCDAAPAKLGFVQRMLLLRDVPLLGGAGVQALTDLARATEMVDVAEGEPLFERGVRRTHAYIVIDGEVEVRHEDPAVTARFGPRSLVGGAVALGDHQLEWEARAVEKTRVLAAPIDVWGDEMDDHFDLFRSAVGVLSDHREALIDLLVARRDDELVLR